MAAKAVKTLQSSHLNRISYSADEGELTVEFVNGSVYKYSEVPFEQYYKLLHASSPGAYFLSNIRDRYQTSKISK